MREAFRLKGQWWLPQSPGTKITGSLAFEPMTGAQLELDGSFFPPTGPQPVEVELIHGQMFNGHLVTLLNCLCTSNNLNLPALLSSATYFCHYVFDGAIFPKTSDLKFDRIVVGLSNLDNWLDISGFAMKPRKNPKAISLRYTLPRNKSVRISDDLSIDIGFGISGPNFTNPQISLQITQSPGFVIKTRRLHDMNYFLELLALLRGFLSLAVGVPVVPTEVTARVLIRRSVAEQRLMQTARKSYRHSVNIYFMPAGVTETAEPQPTYRMLFSFPEIEARWPAIIGNWLQRYEKLRQSYQLYTSMLYRRVTFIEEEFLGYARAIESYHRQAMNNFALSEEEFDRRRQVVLSKIPEKKVRKWLEGKLKYFNEPSLETRLREILNKYADLVPLPDQERKALAKTIADTRNDITHPGNRSGREAPAGRALYQYGQQLRFLVELCFMSEMGFQDADLNTVVNRQRQWKGSRWPWP